MWLLVAFIGIPLIEIALFIQVGSAIGLWTTLLVVVLTAILGTYLVRQQGLAALQNLKTQFNTLNDPTEALAHGAMILFSGALLLTPGFFTDAVGFALLIPRVRKAAFEAMRSRVNVQTFGSPQSGMRHRESYESNVIDGEFQEIQPEPRRTHGPSGWTKEDS